MYLDVNKEGWKNYFRNSNQALCKINRCYLKQQDCQTDYEEKSNMLKLMPDSPWNIVAKVNNTKKDFEETVCYNCTNFQQSVAFPNIVVSLKVQEYPPSPTKWNTTNWNITPKPDGVCPGEIKKSFSAKNDSLRIPDRVLKELQFQFVYDCVVEDTGREKEEADTTSASTTAAAATQDGTTTASG